MSLTKKLIIISIVIILIPILYIVLGWTIVWAGMWLASPTPSEPLQTYGEFPFELTYKIDGETVTIRDVYVCEYDGIGVSEASGKYRKWKGYIKGTGETAVFLTEDDDRKIYCYVGDAEFYMGDEKFPEKRPLTPRLYSKPKYMYTDSYFSEEIMEHYKIEIISWFFSEPIENSFD